MKDKILNDIHWFNELCDEIKIILPSNAEFTLESVPAPSEVNSVLPPESLTVFVFTMAPVGTATVSPASPSVTVVPD